MGAVQDLTEAVQTGFAHHEDILNRHDKALNALHEGQENIKEQLNDVDRRLINTQNRVEDIADTLELDHERRIHRLEKARV